MQPPGRLDFEAWAHVAARLRRRPPEEQHAILTDLGLEAIWHETNEAWSAELNADIAAGRLERPERYARLCAEDLSRRTPDFRDQLTPRAEEPPPPLADQVQTSELPVARGRGSR